MNEHSFTAYFHNQKDGTVFPDNTGAIKDPLDHKYLEWIKDEERRSKIQELGSSSELQKMVEDLVSSIKDAELEKIVQDDPEQIAELEKSKKNANKMILGVLEQVEKYLQTIRNMDVVRQRKKELDQKDFLAEFESADKTRTMAHNALMSQIIATIRFISRTFGDVSPKAIEEWEKERESRNLPVLMAQRIKLLKNIFIPNKVDIYNRDHIAAWADLISVSLSELRQEIKKDSPSP